MCASRYRRMLGGMRMLRLLVCAGVAAAIPAAAIGCGGSPPEAASRYVRYHDPGGGWTAEVPAGWTSVVLGPEFVRDQPLTDPTRLLLRTYRDRSPAAALRALAVGQGIIVAARTSEPASDGLRWQRYRGRKAGEPELAAELAVAQEGAHAHVAALIARRAEYRSTWCGQLCVRHSTASPQAARPAGQRRRASRRAHRRTGRRAAGVPRRRRRKKWTVSGSTR